MEDARLIPENLARTAVEMLGESGAAWIESLPARISVCEERWSLSVGRPFPNLSFDWVAPAKRADETEAVLKLWYPGGAESRSGAEALGVFDGRGVTRVLELDLENGATLLERVIPGAPLTGTSDDDEMATRILAGVMKNLWRPPPPGHSFQTVFERTRALARLRERFDGGTGPIPEDLVKESENLLEELIPTQAEPVLLHGDLHHDNVLLSGKDFWIAIDPKGIVGEPAFEVGAMLHNPAGFLETPDPARSLEGRIDILSEELDLPKERIRNWGVSLAVLAACWSLEDTGRVWNEALTFARLLSGNG